MLFDTDITQLPKPFDRKKGSYDFKGRGGTCFQPVMDEAEKRRYSSLIILTDGEAAAPTRPKFVKDIIWVLVGTSNPPVEWGKRVRVVTQKGYK
jgi:predicted metal-dependent peptidase